MSFFMSYEFAYEFPEKPETSSLLPIMRSYIYLRSHVGRRQVSHLISDHYCRFLATEIAFNIITLRLFRMGNDNCATYIYV